MKDIDTLLKEVKRIHFIGIGGSGMCPLAEILLSLGYQLSGSDNNDTETFRRIEKEGAKVYLGQTKANLTPDIQLVIYTNAILKGNEELEWAKTHYPCFERAELLGRAGDVAAPGNGRKIFQIFEVHADSSLLRVFAGSSVPQTMHAGYSFYEKNEFQEL